MRYIQNVELREWVKESLRKTIFQKAHALSIQTGCEILVKLHDAADVTSHQYYATGSLHSAYKGNTLHKHPKDKLVSGDTGLPQIDYVDQAIQSGYADEHLSEADDGQVGKLDSFTQSQNQFDSQSVFDSKDQQTVLPLHLTVSNEPSCDESENKETSERELSTDNGQLPEGVQIKVEKEDNESEGTTCMISETLDTNTQSTEPVSFHDLQDDLPMDTTGVISTDSLQGEEASVGTFSMPMSPKPYQCALCQKAFRSVQVLQKHTQTFHFRGQGSSGSSFRGRGRGYASSSSLKRYQCVMCSRSFPHPDLLQDHMSRSHMGSPAMQQLASQSQPSDLFPPNSSAESSSLGSQSQGPFHLTASSDQSQPSTSGVLSQSWTGTPSTPIFAPQKRKLGGMSSYRFPRPGRPGALGSPANKGQGTSPKKRGPVPMPALKTAILLTAGPVGSYSAFIQSGPRNLKTTVTRHQYIDATEQLAKLQLGSNLSNDKPYGRAQVWFVKKPPEQITEILQAHEELCHIRDYGERYSLPLPKNVNISEEIKQELIEGRYLLSTHENQLLNRTL
ncbi:uncharacterized protein [Amphiura filiformis]|uniref:uncharacterized protein isoform X2 n=1 Tax=Amphiura filiformis TaxID=82378 RepID=UPI003B224040